KLGLVGTPEDLRKRAATLEAGGIDEIVIQPVLDPEREMTDFARLF
ncbi:5,10-methylene tetrahydromethanopterin reductase, partial [Actinomadura sp. HBU206391]|nr:5,10-methylene tetrahydromethanopterin reductase [Actinomadura sp. HBU206391]